MVGSSSNRRLRELPGCTSSLTVRSWITPSIFQGQPGFTTRDEYTLTLNLGRQRAYEILKPHWDSWARQEDFNRIARAGFNLVRIPIGYWAFKTFESPYVSGAQDYLDAAIGWARAAGLKVIIDLHGAPRSQNGFDNSGQRLDSPGWQMYDSVEQTLEVLQLMANKYARSEYNDVVAAIELVNEPLGPELDVNKIRKFYRDGFDRIRAVSGSVTVIISDAFLSPNYWNGFLTPGDNNAQNVAIDHHHYQVFTSELVSMSHQQHVQELCDAAAYNYGGSDKWTFVGEWTAAMTGMKRALPARTLVWRTDFSSI